MLTGELTATVTVDPVADSAVEPDETVILTVVAGSGYAVGAPSSATGTITNDDTDVSVAVAPASTLEDGAGNLVYTFTRTGVTTGALTANFTINGTATFNTDYTQTGAATFTPPTGTVNFTAGSSTATVTIDPTADTTVEPDETVILTVAAGTGYNVAAVNSSATGTITNDDTDVSSRRCSVVSCGRWGNESGLHLHASGRDQRSADGQLHDRRHGHVQHRLHAGWSGDLCSAQRHGDIRRG